MPVLEQHRNQITGVRTDGVGLAAHRHGIAFHPLPRPFTAAAPLVGGDGATPPPVAPTATARSPRAVATVCSERRLVDERPIFTPAELAEIEAEMEAGIGLPASRDRWPEPGGESFRALTDRDWRQETCDAGDDLPGPWFVVAVIALASGFAMAFGIGIARLVAVLL